jgi:6-phosphogluconolactonase (cycloisomerase 2 family)
VEGQSGVDGYKINPLTGALKLLAGSPFANGAGGGSMATDPLGKFVYGVSGVGTTVYTVESSSGALTQVATAPIGGEIVPDPTGTYLYTPDVMRVDRNSGVLTPLMEPGKNNAIGPLAVSTGTAHVQYVPKFVYVANSADNTISGYSEDAARGRLSPLGTYKTGITPRSLATDLNGKYLYVTNFGSNTLSTFRINSPTGTLTPVKGSPYATDLGPGAVAVSPSGSAVYVASETTETVTSFTVNSSTGQLTNLGPTWYGTLCGSPNSLALNPVGTYLYASCAGSSVAAAVSGPPPIINGHETLGTPMTSLAMHPTGTSLYLIADPTIDQISVNGFYLQAPNVEFGDNTLTGGLALDPFGRFLYAVEGNANMVQGEKVAVNSTLSEISGSPFATGAYPVAGAVDYSGKFLYVVNQNDNNISAHVIDQTTGALTPLTPATFATGKVPSSMVVTGTVK